MGLFNKIKDILFVDEGDDLPVISKKEEVKEDKIVMGSGDVTDEINEPKPDDVMKRVSPFVSFDEDEFERLNNKVNDREILSREALAREPIMRDNPRVVTPPRREPIVKREPVREPVREVPRRESYSPNNFSRNASSVTTNKYDLKKEDKRPFKPSPVVSPVYGVLNKNYKEEEIVERKHPVDNSRDIDKIRDKAFGITEEIPVVIEEEIIITRTETPSSIDDLILEDFNEANVENDIFDNITENIEDNNIKDEDVLDNSEDLIEEHTSALEILDEIEKELDKSKEEKEDSSDGDLFNLIDSMYDNRKDEE